MSQGRFRRRIVQFLLDLLCQGITPEQIALSIALGLRRLAMASRLSVRKLPGAAVDAEVC
jgi:hypothetical protein